MLRAKQWTALLAAGVFLVACGGVPPPQAGPASTAAASLAPDGAPTFGRASLTIRTKTGPLSMSVEVADDEPTREYGLMNRRSLPDAGGMLFVFNPPANASVVGFWMKDTLIPLSIAFVEPTMAIESVQEMQAEDRTVHYAPRDYAYAIEANAGFFASHGVTLGDTLTIAR